MKILLVDDENSLRENIKNYLVSENFQVLEADSVASALQLNLQDIRLILLDWMLPDGSGLDLLKTWRQQGLQIPILFLTAKSDLIDKILGLESGSNDYITKPFEPRELLARIRVHLRKPAVSQLNLNGITMDLENRTVQYQSQTISLTKTEFELLRFFMLQPEKAFSRDEILQNVWGYEQFPTTRTVDVHVLQLRQKFHSSFFETLHGVGYRMKRFS